MLRPFEENDLELTLPWRNSLMVRSAMYTQHEIGLDEHRAWYRKIQADKTNRWFLYVDNQGKPLGVVYFADINRVPGNALWGFYAKPDATPGTGLRISLEAIDFAFSVLKLHKINAEVFASNPRSLGLHKRVGFVEEGLFRDHFCSGENTVDVIRLSLLAREWPESRQSIDARIARLDEFAAAVTHPNEEWGYRIVILSDAQSWLNNSIADLLIDWVEQGHKVSWLHDIDGIPPGDFCFCLSFSKIVSADVRSMFRHTLVVHESDLPKGKGWSPLTWQILDGAHRIPVTLFEAADQVDSGSIYAQYYVEFNGNELVDELRAAQANATLDLCSWFLATYPQSAERARPQHGEESFYARRGPEHSELEPHKSIAQQFDLLRVVDNEKYPAFFYYKGRKFELKVYLGNET